MSKLGKFAQKLPGIGTEPSWKNKLVGVGYIFLALMVIGAFTPPAEDPAPTEAQATDPTTTADLEDAHTEAASTATTAQTTVESTPTPTATPEPTTKQTTEASSGTTYAVRVIYDGEYSGAISTGTETRSYDGSGTQTFEIEKSDVSAISANAQKQDDSDAELTIQILENGKVVEETSTTAAYGVAQTSASFYGW